MRTKAHKSYLASIDEAATGTRQHQYYSCDFGGSILRVRSDAQYFQCFDAASTLYSVIAHSAVLPRRLLVTVTAAEGGAEWLCPERQQVRFSLTPI